MGRLDGKVALITGGARGQGAAEGRLFAAEGAEVVLTDVLDTDGEKTAADIRGQYYHHDVTSEADWASVIDRILESHGRLDVLVNNAGIWLTGRMTDTSLADYRRVIEVNQIGVFLGMQAASKPMMAARKGSIINISSIAGLRNSGSGFAYGASKWAVRGMTKTAARELGPYGVRVNSIHPGLIETAMLHQLPGVDSGRLDAMTAGIPLGRIADATEVANLALYLASDESSYSTGSEFIVDGGMTS
jgi:3alpha(or 20beta)-hydroxysteroid dehydrogenase